MKEFYNCFIGIPLPHEFKYDMEELVKSLRQYLPNASLVETSVSHITLYYLGHQKERKLEEISDIIYEEKDLIGGEKLNITNLGIFYSENKITEALPYVIYIQTGHTERLRDFKEHLNSHLDSYNREERINFIPHLTIARLKTDQSKSEFKENSPEIEKLLTNVKWRFKIKEIFIYGKTVPSNANLPEIIFRIPLI